ncbi:MAG TPA: UPF0158 family protein, partial [Ardenticatenaceae bacterium]|nr:UPF0158 family protein [Ardenticatenaceae bacterium]
TGDVVMVTDDDRRQLEEIYEEILDEDGNERMSLAEALAERDLPEWEQKSLVEADAVERESGTRFIAVPRADSREGYRDMQAFIETVRDEGLQGRLWRAIQGRGAFRYFKDVVADVPHERERWFQFEQARVRQRILEWLADEGIEPLET